jgi:hypothetical protein
VQKFKIDNIDFLKVELLIIFFIFVKIFFMETSKYIVSAKLDQSEGDPIWEEFQVNATCPYDAIGKAQDLFWNKLFKTENRFAHVKELKVKNVYLDF